MNKEVRKILLFLIFIGLLLFGILFIGEDVLLQPTGPTIDEITPNIIYNSQQSEVTVYGSDLSQSLYINVNLQGSVFPLEPSLYQIEWISDNEVRINLNQGLPQIQAEISLVNENNEETNYYPFEVRSGVPPQSPSIAQVSPIGLENAPNLEVLPATVWGNNFDSIAKIIIDGNDLSSRILTRTDKKIDFYIFNTEIESLSKIRVYNEGNYRSNEFNIKENTVKYPDILYLSSSVLVGESTINITGHNFFQSTSELYLDANIVPKTDYIFINNSDGTFTIELQLNNLALGIHSIYFDTSPRRPSVNYQRYKSNKVYFELKSLLRQQINLENNLVKISFSGDNGAISRIENKQTGYIYRLNSMYPWRIQLRQIVNPTNLSVWINPPQSKDYFNPYIGDCTRTLSSQFDRINNIQKLTIRWNSCAIDSQNHFNYIQEYLLEDNRNYVEMNFYTENIDVTNYSIYLVKNYITFLDDDFNLNETGMQSGRGLEVIKNPAYNILSKGGRNICYDWTESEPADGQPSCGATGYESLLPAEWIRTDGDGYQLHPNSYLDFWIGYWNENGDYIYAIPVDNYTYAKGYSYVGERGRYKNTANTLYPESFNPTNFDYKMPYKYRIGVGKGTQFTDEETWINIADNFKTVQQELDMLNTPYKLRDVPEHVRYLDLGSLVPLDREFFDIIDGRLIPKQNPNSSQIAKLFEESRNYFGAEESTLFIWGGEQDRARGLRYEPIPGITLPFLSKLNEAGWNPCFYSVNGALQIQVDEEEYRNMIGQETEFDPTGQPVIINSSDDLYRRFTMTSAYSDSLEEGESSYLKWFLEKYRILNNNHNGARCFYSDGIFGGLVYGSGGPWSRLYNQRGWDEKAMTSLKDFFKKEFEELRRIDPDTYTFHEAASQFSTDEGLFPVQATPGGIAKESLGSGTHKNNAQSIQFYQRVWGGYQDFIFSNEMSDPNLIIPTYIPENFYDFIKGIDGVDQDYNKTLAETYALPGMVGFMYKGAIPFYVEPGVKSSANYTSIVNFDQAPIGAIQEYWYHPLKSYADVNKELVQSRQLARNYFQGLWHPSVTIRNSINEKYYYIVDYHVLIKQNSFGLSEVSVPRVISTVRQPWGNESWAERYGIMFLNTYLREPGQTINFEFDFDRYGAIRGANYNLFKYSKENGREYLGTYSDSFSYTINIPARKFVLLELEKDGDQDGDSITGVIDLCPNTGSNKMVNSAGCPIPSMNEFSSQLTSNLAQSNNLLNYRDLSVGVNNMGRIEYAGQELRLLRFDNREQSLNEINISDAIEIIHNKISVKTEDYPELNQTARITFYDLNYTSTPLVTVQTSSGFVPCDSSRCSIQSYNPSTGQLVVNVVGFSNYSTQASTGTTTGSSSGSTSTSGGSSGSSGGTTSPPRTNTLITQCNDKIDNDGDHLIDYPADNGCTNEEDNLELTADLTQGASSGNEVDNQSKDYSFRFIFWIVLFMLVTGIIITTIKIIRMSSLNKRFSRLSQRSSDLNNAFNTNQSEQDLLRDNN
ncbi:MAG: hypothetical protein AABX10_05300 [Nanoarchaeota archaeon]